MQLIDKNGARPVCQDCNRRVGPRDRKRWRCLECRIERAKRLGDRAEVAGLELNWYAMEARRAAGER
jgi:hypothetical protein